MNSTAEKSQAGEAVSCHRGRSARKVSKTVVWLNILLYTGLAALCVIAHVGLGQPMGAFASEIQTTETGLVPIAAPRGLDTETSSIVSDLAGCDATSDSAMPTPSDVYITETVDGATASLTVTPISALST
ncbi:hypothetical protein BT67DRAFT_433527 [Trichocladium antarcticum]|uniref:Uncharacterized protein n=1 Tax=Trichocladium antarcticum TaxID=1450529 RepID=A0AAN6ZEZ1_9PEZI|nr:hypothetical protein BT67DRAFT_433527 [Trichocladium antarcticum]